MNRPGFTQDCPPIGMKTEFRPIRDQYENCDVAHMTSEQILALRKTPSEEPTE